MSGTAVIKNNSNTNTLYDVYGRGVYIKNAVFSMTGGSIETNETYSAYARSCGAGVYVASGEFIMSGSATISNNSSVSNYGFSNSAYGGAIYIAGGNFKMDGNAFIEENNSGYGGGIYMSGGTVDMIGGKIGGINNYDLEQVEGNNAYDGGGVHIAGGTFAMSHSAVIQGNNANSNGGAIYVDGLGILNLYGGSIDDNYASPIELGDIEVSSGGIPLRLNAKKTQILAYEVFNITYHNMNSYPNPNPTSYTVFDLPLTMSVPTGLPESLNFTGWYDAETDGNIVTDFPLGTFGDKELWAQYTNVPVYSYIVEYYKDNTEPENFIDKLSGTSSFKALHTLTESDIANDLGVNWINLKQPENYTGLLDKPLPTILADLNNNVIKVVYKKNTYTVKYNANAVGTSTLPSDKSYDYASEVAIEKAISRSGFTFVGWNTMADSTGTMYDSSNTFVMPKHDVILYAIWKKDIVDSNKYANPKTSDDTNISYYFILFAMGSIIGYCIYKFRKKTY